MRIIVGIHEDVVIANAVIDDKGRMNLVLRTVDEKPEEEEDANPFDKLNAAEVIEKDSGSGLTLWPFKTPEAVGKDDKPRSTQEMGEIATEDIKRLKNVLQQILEQYMVKDDIKWNVFDGAAVSKETYYEDIISQNNLDIVYRNMCEQFMAMIQPYLNKDEYAVRFKLQRQNAEKHYARIPDRFIKDNPFIERMSIPKEQSRVKWTPYELKNKLNDPTPVSRETADETEETPESESVFGSR